MERRIIISLALALTASPIFAAETEGKPVAEQAGMQIKGDHEAPLVLYIVPWQEPSVPDVPEADLQPVLPNVLDDDFGILRRSRSIGAKSSEN